MSRKYNVTGFGTKNRSRNVKIASTRYPLRKPVFAVYRPVGPSCPSDCALLDAGCYAQQGNVNIHQRRANGETFDPVAWADRLPMGALIRWNVSGDVVGPDGAEYREAIKLAHTLRPYPIACGSSRPSMIPVTRFEPLLWGGVLSRTL